MKERRFSVKSLVIFVLIFGGVGSYLLYVILAAPASTVSSLPISVYTYITGANATGCSTCAQNPAHTVSEIENSVNAPLVAGFSWVIPWSDIETGPNQYNWAEIDNAIAASAGHKVMLRVIAGEDSPAWVTSSVPSVNATFPLAGGGSQSKTIPILWDSGYLTDWTQFIAAYGSRYANNPNVTVVQMPGGGRIGESSIGDWAGWLSNSPTPNGAGSEPYTDARMLTAWEQIVNAYATAFPSTSSVQLAIDDDGPSLIANGTTYTVQPALASYITSTVASTYHVHPWFQANDLGHNGSGAVNFLTNLETVTKIGWQEWLGNQGCTATSCTFEDNAAQTAITTHSTYVEWYLSDILNAYSYCPLYLMAKNNGTSCSTSPSPSISSITPSSGTTAGGTATSMAIVNFPSGTPSSVTFGGSAGSGISRSGNTVSVTTPAHSAGAVNVVVTIGSSSATDASGYTYVTPTTNLPDLVVQSLAVNPASPVVNDQVSFSMVVKNQGSLAIPSGTAIGAAFQIDGTNVTLERGYSSGLGIGATATLSANQGASGGSSFWIASAGNHTLKGIVNDQGTIQESNSTNNTLSQALNVPNPPPPQAPNPPTNLISPSQTTSTIALSWTASVPGTGGDPSSLLVYHIKRNGVEVGHTAQGITSYTDTGLSPATTYSYTIYATDTANRSSADSNAFTQATQGLNCAVPPAPGNLSGTPSSDGTSATLSWNPVSATAPCSIAHYEIAQDGITIAQVTTTNYNVTNLTPATTYSFSVLAVTNDATAGSASTVNLTTPAITDTTPPTAPSNLAAMPVSSSQINLAWSASSDAESGIKDYQVERDGQVIGSTTALSFGDSNLSSNTTYTYIVVAVNGVNLTTASSSVSATSLVQLSPSGGSGNNGNPGSIPQLQNTTSVGSGSDSSSSSSGSSNLTYNPTATSPISDNPSAANTTPDSKNQTKTASLDSRLVGGLAGSGLILFGLGISLFYLRRHLVNQLNLPRLNLSAEGPQGYSNTRLDPGTIISPDNPEDHDKENRL